MIRRLRPATLCLVLLCCASRAGAQNPPQDYPRPIEALDLVFIEEMTWLEVRDAIAAGKTTAIVATGGVEQNGPYLATGKHNYVLRGVTESLARKLDDALVAPIVAFVPEGDIDPPSGHMVYPGSIGVSEETFQRLLKDICASLRTGGFRNIVLVGDSGGNQTGMKAVADELNKAWSGGKARVHFIAQFYDYAALGKWVESQGISQQPEGHHDDFVMTAQMMAVDPVSVRARQRIAADKFRINGVELAPAEKTIAWGKKIIDYRADLSAKAIREAIAAGGK